MVLLTEEELSRTTGLMNALGNLTRMRIVLLVGGTQRPLHIKAIAEVLGRDYAAVYRHIKILEKSGLLEIYEVGRSRVIALKRENVIQEFIEFAKKLVPKSE
jgi:DNA-binding transcriptional ArsR family regulator